MKVSVFTPTYNRAYIIESLYSSLKRQTNMDFEWIIIDDGSTDDTEELFKRITSERNNFDVKYQKVSNGGKHRAINEGVLLAKGDLFFIVDSDDYLTDDAIEKIIEVEDSIPNDQKKFFAGVCGEKGFSVEKSVGNTFEHEYLDITSLEREKYNITGDKAEVFYTDVLRKYPFPEFEGENFVTECVVWDRIAHDGLKLRFFNDIIYICDYLPDGLTAHYRDLYKKNPASYGLYIYQCGAFGKTYGVEKWKEYYKYYYTFIDKIGLMHIAKNLHYNPIALWIRIFGMKVFYKLYDH